MSKRNTSRNLGALVSLCLLACSACTSTSTNNNNAGASGVSGGAGAAGFSGTFGGAGVLGTAGSAAGIGGMSGAGGVGGAAGSAAGAGGSGGDVKTVVATIAGFGTGTVAGTATFTSSPGGVTVVVQLTSCPDGVHPVHIHEGKSCMDATTQGAHWDMTRGEGIPDVTCSGNMGTVTYTRMNTDPKPWTVGAGDPTTDVDGHAFVVHDMSAVPPPRIGCGVISSAGSSSAKKATATIAGFGTGTVTGTAAFTQNGADVTVVVTLANCPDGAHPVHIHEGTSCMDATVQGAHWDMTRGEGIPDVTCTGNAGTVTYTRLGSDAKPWTVSAGVATTDVNGHAVVVHDMSATPPPRIGCGLVL